MIKKIAHIADLHFRNFQRHDEFRTVCENFISKVIKEDADRIVIAGDIVHSRNQLSPELVSEVSWFLRECSKITRKVIIIPGNHDIVEQNKERMDALTPIIETLKLDNIVYLTSSQMVIDENVVWVVYSIYDNNLPPDDMHLGKYNAYTKVGLFHGIISGAVNDLGFTFTHGSDTKKFANCDIVLCGDVHKRQVLFTTNERTNKTIPIIMVGSMIQQDFSETITKHGYATINIGNDISYDFVDIDSPVKFLNFVIRDFEDIVEGDEVLVNV